MTTLRFLVSLITKDNDYQMEQAAAAKAAAAELGVEAQIIYANDDHITQSTQLYKDSAGPKRRIRLDGLEELRAVLDGMVVGINDLGLDTEFRRGGFRGCGLFHLIVVVLGYQRNQETKCRHPMPPPFKQSQSTGVEKERRIANPFPGGLASCTSMRRFRHLNQAGQQIPEVGTLRAAESKIHLAVEGIEPVVYGLCGNLGLKHFVLRTDFVLCFLDGLENARSEKRKNSGT